MKTSLRKQAFILGLTGLVVTLLVLFTVFERHSYENKIQQIDALNEAIVISFSYAKANYKNLPTDADQATISKEVLVPAENAADNKQNLSR